MACPTLPVIVQWGQTGKCQRRLEKQAGLSFEPASRDDRRGLATTCGWRGWRPLGLRCTWKHCQTCLCGACRRLELDSRVCPPQVPPFSISIAFRLRLCLAPIRSQHIEACPGENMQSPIYWTQQNALVAAQEAGAGECLVDSGIAAPLVTLFLTFVITVLSDCSLSITRVSEQRFCVNTATPLQRSSGGQQGACALRVCDGRRRAGASTRAASHSRLARIRAAWPSPTLSADIFEQPSRKVAAAIKLRRSPCSDSQMSARGASVASLPRVRTPHRAPETDSPVPLECSLLMKTLDCLSRWLRGNEMAGTACGRAPG